MFDKGLRRAPTLGGHVARSLMVGSATALHCFVCNFLKISFTVAFQANRTDVLPVSLIARPPEMKSLLKKDVTGLNI